MLYIFCSTYWFLHDVVTLCSTFCTAYVVTENGCCKYVLYISCCTICGLDIFLHIFMGHIFAAHFALHMLCSFFYQNILCCKFVALNCVFCVSFLPPFNAEHIIRHILLKVLLKFVYCKNSAAPFVVHILFCIFWAAYLVTAHFCFTCFLLHNLVLKSVLYFFCFKNIYNYFY